MRRLPTIGFYLLALTCISVFVFQSCLKIESTDGANQTNGSTGLEGLEVPSQRSQSGKYFSLMNQPLSVPDLDPWTRIKRENLLETAELNYKNYPDSLETIYWYGRRLSYLYRYEESIQVYTEGLKKFPDSYKLYRHRGHRYLTTRQIDRAILDLEKAAFYIRSVPVMVEEDGIPNDRNIPRSSIQFNVWYHLGLAYYVKGNFDKAISSYKKCMSLADNHDMVVSATNWLYMTYRKIGNIEAAESLLEPISDKMNIIENYQYHDLLMMYKGESEPNELYDPTKADDSITQLTLGYGVGNWYYYNGHTEKALKVFNKMMESPYWQAFGYLAAEMELANRAIES